MDEAQLELVVEAEAVLKQVKASLAREVAATQQEYKVLRVETGDVRDIPTLVNVAKRRVDPSNGPC